MANHNHNLIKIHRNYTYEELAEVFGIHKNTVATWVKNGLCCLQERRPYLILGGDAKAFLQKQRVSKKQTCKANEFYCLRCREPVKPVENFVSYIPISCTKGRLTGLCEHCESMVNKFVSYANVEKYSLIFSLEKPIGLEHINDTDKPPLNSDFTR
ncbi:MAG: helix-turn-helix domain-containing protein [Cellvibrionaceae bacterium]